MLDREITVYARNAALSYVAQIDFFDELAWVDVYNYQDSPGGWTLTIDANDPATDHLSRPGSGIVVLIDGTVAFSGYTTRIERNLDADTTKYLIAGVDDTGLLGTRIAHPQPGSTAPPYNSTAYDTRTGVCSTILREYVDVNLGPSAVTNRKDPRVTLAADPAVGGSVTGQGRYQQLNVLLNELTTTADGVGYRIRQSGTDLEFQTFAPTDHTTDVVFSVGNGTLSAYSYSIEAGPGNYIFTGGQNEGTSRTIREGYDGPSITRWGRRELFIDARDESTTALLDQTITEELANQSDIASATFVPIDSTQQQYFTHYGVGDKVTVVIDEIPFQQPILEVSCTLNDDGLTVTPTVATPNNKDSLKLYDQIAQHNRRIKNLERR